MKYFTCLLLCGICLLATQGNAQDIEAKLPGNTSTQGFTVKDASSSPLFTVRGDGNVGAGTTSPEFRLSLIGDGGILATGTKQQGRLLSTSGAGTRFIWYPRKAAVRAGTIIGTQWDDSQIGTGSVAMGENTLANGGYSLAMGYGTMATAQYAVALGFETTAGHSYTVAMGRETTASGANATAFGHLSLASGPYSTAMGAGTIASGNYSTALGSSTTASGDNSFAAGYDATAGGSYTVAMGYKPNASADYAVALGRDVVASGSHATALGTAASASGEAAVALGQHTTANNTASTALGYYTTASGKYSTAMGGTTTASGESATAMGVQTLASGAYATAGGDHSTASHTAATAFGQNCTASAQGSVAAGYYCTASGSSSVALGHQNNASGDNSRALGNYTNAESQCSAAFGQYNVGGGSATSWVGSDPLFEIGIGTSSFSRANAVTVKKSGDVTFTKNFYLDGWFYYLWGGVYRSLQVDGTNNNASWSSSDRRLKKDIAPVSDALDRISALRSVCFHWNDDGFAHLTRNIESRYKSASGRSEDDLALWEEMREKRRYELDQQNIGFIAQEVQLVFPEWVREDDGYYEVNTQELSAVLVEALKQLRAEKNREIKRLKQRIARLEERGAQQGAALIEMQRHQQERIEALEKLVTRRDDDNIGSSQHLGMLTKEKGQ